MRLLLLLMQQHHVAVRLLKPVVSGLEAVCQTDAVLDFADSERGSSLKGEDTQAGRSQRTRTVSGQAPAVGSSEGSGTRLVSS